jgi:hypothetical protein
MRDVLYFTQNATIRTRTHARTAVRTFLQVKYRRDGQRRVERWREGTDRDRERVEEKAMPAASRVAFALPAAESARPGVGRAMAIILLGEENTTGFVVWAAQPVVGWKARELPGLRGRKGRVVRPKKTTDQRAAAPLHPHHHPFSQSSHVQRGNHQRRTGVCLRAVRMRMR